jgi:hypothetical protein
MIWHSHLGQTLPGVGIKFTEPRPFAVAVDSSLIHRGALMTHAWRSNEVHPVERTELDYRRSGRKQQARWGSGCWRTLRSTFWAPGSPGR